MTAYGLEWHDAKPLSIEMHCIQQGGRWVHGGVTVGAGLFHHYRAMMSLIWPNDDHHRWSDLMLKTICENRITVIQGPRDCGKTWGMAKFALCDYWCFPDNTLSLVSSTRQRDLEVRAWGNIKKLFLSATERYPWLPGNVADSKYGIFTDQLDDKGDVRVMDRGLICIPCLGSDDQWEGMSRFQGIKQQRRRLYGDEVQFMPIVYVNVLDALDKGDFKGVFLGNPIGGNGKALDKLAEPVAGWSSLGEVTKTATWPNKYEGITINLVGIDSPNFDEATRNKFSYLINQADADRVAARNGKDSAQFWTLIMGVRKTGVDMYRVLTTEMCERNGAFDPVIWSGAPRTLIYAIDAGFGGDPCISIMIEFGEDAKGQQVIKFNPPTMIPVNVSAPDTPEIQISLYAKADCQRLGVPDANVFFDAGMRATLASDMARIMSSQVNAVNFGGTATDRPVAADLFVWDETSKTRRLKKCIEHYSKFVTELWYSVREVVEGKQAREMPRSVTDEFGMREWTYVPGPLGQRIELETKADCKERMGASPNKADAAAIALEGARRLGFVIARMPDPDTPKPDGDVWLEREIRQHRDMMRKRELKFA